MSGRRGTSLRLALLALAWGSSFLWIELALPMLAASWLTVARLLLGTATLGSICMLRGYGFPRGRTAWTHLAVAGLLSNVAPYFLFAVGQNLTNSAYAGILNGTTPLWTALTLLVLTRAAPPLIQGTGLAVGFAGIVLVFEPWSQSGPGSLAGVTACLAAAAMYGLSFVYLSRYVTPLPFNPVALATGQLACAAVLSPALLPLDGAVIHPPQPLAVLAVLILGVVGTGLAYVLNYALVASAGPTTASLVAYLIPVVAVALGVLILGDQLPPFAGLGAALVLLGVALVRRRPSGAANPR
jgi:drug/metabolite transporter (DMT)-like permease